MKPRQPDATVTPHWVITDTRVKTQTQPVKKLLMSEPERNPSSAAEPRVVKPTKKEPVKQNFTSFVSNFARIHGLNYKEALKSADVKNLYKSFNRDQNGQEFFVKHSFEQKRPVYTPNMKKVGETIFIDNRMSTDDYKQSDIKELEKSQQKLQVARGLYFDLKRAYLNQVRGNFALNNFFNQSGHTQESLSPLTDAIVKSILDSAIKTRTKNIHSISPFLEMSILVHSYDKYQNLLKSSNRELIEIPMNPFAQESIIRLNSSVEGNNIPAEFDSCDVFFFNLSSFEGGSQTISELVEYKLDNNQKPFDIYFTNSGKKWSNLTEFYNSEMAENLVFTISTGTIPEKEELLAALKNSNFTQSILQEDNNIFLENLNQTMTNMAGDNRLLLSQILQSQQRKDDGMIYYELTSGQPQNGDFFKTNRSSKPIYRLNTMHPDLENKVKVFVYDTNDDIVQLRKSYVKKNLQKINFLLDRKSQYIIGLDKLAETISEPTIQAILAGQPIAVKPEAEDTPDEGDEGADEGVEGEGVLGGSITRRLDDFRRRFNPTFSYVGRSGIEHVYKMSF